MYDNTTDFNRAAYELYSGLLLPIEVICAKYHLTCLMSTPRTSRLSDGTMYYLCRKTGPVYYLYESEPMHDGSIRDIEPRELTHREAALWVLSHTHVEALIAALQRGVVDRGCTDDLYDTLDDDLDDDDSDFPLPF